MRTAPVKLEIYKNLFHPLPEETGAAAGGGAGKGAGE